MLRKRLEQQQYDTLIRNIKPPSNTTSLFSTDEEEGYSPTDAKMAKNQVSAIVNVLLSMVSVFVAIFIWMKNSPDYLVLPPLSLLSFTSLGLVGSRRGVCMLYMYVFDWEMGVLANDREYCGVCFLRWWWG
jgi:hypothetical protein